MSDARPDGAGPAVVGEVADRVDAALDRLLAGCDAAAVFGEPRAVGDRVVLTAAAVTRVGGFGFGAGSGRGPDDSGGGGGGGGGGGSGDARPVAVVEIGPDGVRVRPVVDLTRIGVVLVAGAVAVWRLSRRR